MKNKEEALAQIRHDLMEHSRSEEHKIMGSVELDALDCDISKGTLECLYKVKRSELNRYDGVHGGVIAYVIDQCTGCGLRMFNDNLVTTTDMSLSYLRAMNKPEYIIRIDYTKVGNSLARALAQVVERQSGKIAATAQLTYMILEGKIQ